MMAETFNMERCRAMERRVDTNEEAVAEMKIEIKDEVGKMRAEMRPLQDFLAWFNGGDVKKQITESYHYVMASVKFASALSVLATILGIVGLVVGFAK